MRNKIFALVIGLLMIMFGPALISSCSDEEINEPFEYVFLQENPKPLWPKDTTAIYLLNNHVK